MSCAPTLTLPTPLPTSCHERVVFHLVDDPFLHGAADSYMGLAVHSYSDVLCFSPGGNLPKLNLKVDRGTDFKDCALSNPPPTNEACPGSGSEFHPGGHKQCPAYRFTCHTCNKVSHMGKVLQIAQSLRPYRNMSLPQSPNQQSGVPQL